MTQITNQPKSESDSKNWWGQHSLPIDQWCNWQIGSLSLFIRRSTNEIFFARSHGEDPFDTALNLEIPGTLSPDLESMEKSRFLLSNTDGEFSLALGLADRSVVARPDSTLCIPSNQKASLYVSTTLWLQPTMDGKTLFEFPVFRPSDTWFGVNTREGELCYFSRTRARTADSESSNYPHRAVTKITVINDSATNLTIERLRVPVKNLHLYVDENGLLVTDSITVKLNESGFDASLTIQERDTRPENFDLLAEPREPSHGNLIGNTFAKLFE